MKKYIKKIVFGAIFLCLVILGFNCSSEEKRSYDKARLENTVSAYENFLIQYPESQYKDSVNFLIEKIYFTKAKDINSINSYIDFLKRYANNNFTSEVEELLGKKGTIIELTKKELVPIQGLSGSISDRCWLEYRGLLETESEDESSNSGFILWYKREGFDSEATKVDLINGKVGQVLGGTWAYKLLRKGQQLSITEYDVYGRPKTTRMPIETVLLTVKINIISSNGSQAKVLLLPESKIVTKKQ